MSDKTPSIADTLTNSIDKLVQAHIGLYKAVNKKPFSAEQQETAIAELEAKREALRGEIIQLTWIASRM